MHTGHRRGRKRPSTPAALGRRIASRSKSAARAKDLEDDLGHDEGARSALASGRVAGGRGRGRSGKSRKEPINSPPTRRGARRVRRKIRGESPGAIPSPPKAGRKAPKVGRGARRRKTSSGGAKGKSKKRPSFY